MPLPSTRLYWRMALYIGAALVAFVLLSMASVWFVARGELENYTATKHSGLGREAARVLSGGGREALLRWLDPQKLQRAWQVEEAPLPEEMADWPELPGVNLPLALRRLSGNVTLLRKLLAEFATTWSPESLRSAPREDLPRMAHTLYGAAATLGMTRVGSAR